MPCLKGVCSSSKWSVVLCGNVSPVLPGVLIFSTQKRKKPKRWEFYLVFQLWRCLLLLFKHFNGTFVVCKPQFFKTPCETGIEVGVWRLGVPDSRLGVTQSHLPQAHLAPVFLTLECACESPGPEPVRYSTSGNLGLGAGGSVEKILGLVGKAL